MAARVQFQVDICSIVALIEYFDVPLSFESVYLIQSSTFQRFSFSVHNRHLYVYYFPCKQKWKAVFEQLGM